MLYKMALSMAQSFYANNGEPYDDGDIEVYAYGLEIFLSTILEISTILVWALCIGQFFETVAFLAAFMPLRSFAGGYHAKTVFRCFLGLVMVYAAYLIVFHFIPIFLTNYISISLAILSFIPIFKLAPLEDVNKPIGSIQRKTFRKKSIATYLIQAGIIVALTSFGIITSIVGLRENEIFPYLCLSFAIGQFSAAGSLVAAKIRNAKGGVLDAG